MVEAILIVGAFWVYWWLALGFADVWRLSGRLWGFEKPFATFTRGFKIWWRALPTIIGAQLAALLVLGGGLLVIAPTMSSSVAGSIIQGGVYAVCLVALVPSWGRAARVEERMAELAVAPAPPVASP